MPPIIDPPVWFTLSEVADNFTHTFGAVKKSRNYTIFQTSQRRFFMLREGILIYYQDQNVPKGCMDLAGSSTKSSSSGDSVCVESGVGEVKLELSELIITKEFVDWKVERAERDKPQEALLKSPQVAAAEITGAVRFHAGIAFLKRGLGEYFETLLADKEQAVIAGSRTWHALAAKMKGLVDFVLAPSNGLESLVMHGAWNGGGAHPLVQKLWQSYAQLLYLQVEADMRAENAYIPDMVDMYNRFVQSCMARTISTVQDGSYDNNDPTMGIVRINQVLAIQGKFEEYVPSTKVLVDYSLQKTGPNLLASTQCILLAITLRDELGEKAQARVWAEKALEIFEAAANKEHHPLVFPCSEQERRANLRAALETFN
jgi:hypothetical protein